MANGRRLVARVVHRRNVRADLNESFEQRKAEAEYALEQLRAKGLDALKDPRVARSLAESQVRSDRMDEAIKSASLCGLT